MIARSITARFRRPPLPSREVSSTKLTLNMLDPREGRSATAFAFLFGHAAYTAKREGNPTFAFFIARK
jgi:hypothetical protein